MVQASDFKVKPDTIINEVDRYVAGKIEAVENDADKFDDNDVDDATIAEQDKARKDNEREIRKLCNDENFAAACELQARLDPNNAALWRKLAETKDPALLDRLLVLDTDQVGHAMQAEKDEWLTNDDAVEAFRKIGANAPVLARRKMIEAMLEKHGELSDGYDAALNAEEANFNDILTFIELTKEPNRQNQNGRTPLMLAIEAGNVDAVTQLLRVEGTDIALESTAGHRHTAVKIALDTYTAAIGTDDVQKRLQILNKLIEKVPTNANGEKDFAAVGLQGIDIEWIKALDLLREQITFPEELRPTALSEQDIAALHNGLSPAAARTKLAREKENAQRRVEELKAKLKEHTDKIDTQIEKLKNSVSPALTDEDPRIQLLLKKRLDVIGIFQPHIAVAEANISAITNAISQIPEKDPIQTPEPTPKPEPVPEPRTPTTPVQPTTPERPQKPETPQTPVQPQPQEPTTWYGKLWNWIKENWGWLLAGALAIGGGIWGYKAYQKRKDRKEAKKAAETGASNGNSNTGGSDGNSASNDSATTTTTTTQTTEQSNVRSNWTQVYEDGTTVTLRSNGGNSM